MGNCRNKKFRDMLHLYELGLLSPEDRSAFELHLFECPECLQEIQVFQKASGHLCHSPRVRDLTEQTVEEYERNASARGFSIITAIKKISFRRFMPSLAVVTVLLVLLLVKPWEIELRTDQKAVAAENRILIIDFDNLSDPEDRDQLGRIISSLLTADLSGSGYIQVIPYQQLLDIARSTGLDGSSESFQNNAGLIANRARADWLVTGTVIRNDSGMAITYQVTEISSGDLIGSRSILGVSPDELFDMADRLSMHIKRDLSLPRGAYGEIDLPVSAVSTSSFDAYRYYIEGIDSYHRFLRGRAVESFVRALEYDSTFAMAYYWLSKLQNGPIAYENIKKAKNYAQKATHLEQCYIIAYDAYLNQDDSLYVKTLEEITERYPDEKEVYLALGTFYYETMNYVAARFNLEHITEIDPGHRNAHNLLAYVHMETGDYTNALSETEKYLALAPDEPNPYDTRGDLFALYGETGKAREAYQSASDKNSRYYASLLKLGQLNLHTDSFPEAERIFRQIAISGDNPAEAEQARLNLAYIPIFAGNYNRALRALDSGMATLETAEESSKSFFILSQYHRLKALVFAEMSQFDRAIQEMTAAIRLHDSISFGDSLTYRTDHAILLARAGLYEEAESVIEKLKIFLLENKCFMLPYYHVKGNYEIIRGNNRQAVELLTQAAGLTNVHRDYLVYFDLARASLQAGDYARAAEEFERLSRTYSNSRMSVGIEIADLRYYLGRAYEGLKRYSEAIEQYKRYLHFRGNGDYIGTEVSDAIKRIEVLKSMLSSR